MKRSPWLLLRQLAERRLPALTRLRRLEALPIRLHRKRIYIMPTGFGVGFAVLLMVMLVGALNYSNNAALLLTCLLGGTAVNSMLASFRALDGLCLESIAPGTARAGEPLPVKLHFASGDRTRRALRIDAPDGTAIPLSLQAGEGCDITLSCPTERRGWMSMPRIRVHSTWPFGLFRAWSWLAPDRNLLVYPQAEGAGPPPRAEADDHLLRRRRQGEETAALRDYRPGDPRKLVAWKASARHEGLLVRDTDTPAPRAERVFDWHAMHGLDDERRISRLVRWIDEAAHAGTTWTLRLPSQTLGPAHGSEHFHRCLRTLAELP